jgi:hypothetical protein
MEVEHTSWAKVTPEWTRLWLYTCIGRMNAHRCWGILLPHLHWISHWLLWNPGALSFWMDSGVGPTYKQNKSHVLKMHNLIHVDLHKRNPTAPHSQKVHQLRPCTIEHGTPLAVKKNKNQTGYKLMVLKLISLPPLWLTSRNLVLQLLAPEM